MNTIDTREAPRSSRRVRAVLHKYFSLREGQADHDSIDRDLRAGIGLRGTNLWILMSAIFIASIGLDVNSTAVIIGAMLISPLMGPIMGLGYGIGIYDFPLIRRSLKNLAVATLISLATSTLYFSLSPLTGEHSELLARTSPSIWDVLIALFGGLVGMVGATRSEKTNVIPGVAIATALMPPLCTAGYGLAHGNLHYFAGAFYLFSINCVFIAFATVVVTWAIRSRLASQIDAGTQRRVRRLVLAAVVLTAVPSVILAYRLVTEEVFTARADHFINAELSLPFTVVANRQIDATKRRIEVTLVGQRADQQTLDALSAKLPGFGLPHSELVVRQAGHEQIDAAALQSSLKASLASELMSANQAAHEAARQELNSKDQTIAHLRQQIDAASADDAELARIARELHAQYPQVNRVLYSKAFAWDASASEPDAARVVTFVVSTPKPIPKAERRRLEAWLKVRMEPQPVQLVTAS